MPLQYERAVPNPKELFLRDPAAEIAVWHGQEVLRLSGQGASLALIPELCLSQGKIEVDIEAEGAAYAGIAFRALDTYNYELAYIQPHTSGCWDALQYDPVFHGSNTWQVYYGAGAQQMAQVPPQTWIRLKVEFKGQQALVQAGEQPPLLVSRLAHPHQSGLVGIWTYLPAHFANLRVWDDLPDWTHLNFPALPGENTCGLLDAWFLDGFGKVNCEPGGILNLNRYLPVTVKEVRLIRQIEMLENGSLTLDLGFSDELNLQMDDQVIFTG